MHDLKAALMWTVAALVLVSLVTWGLLGNGLAQQRVFAPRFEATRRTTFEQSKAYRDGVAQDLNNMRRQYVTATPEQRVLLAGVIRHRLAGFDLTALSPDLRAFVLSLPQ